jgi:hypothetical protein
MFKIISISNYSKICLLLFSCLQYGCKKDKTEIRVLNDKPVVTTHQITGVDSSLRVITLNGEVVSEGSSATSMRGFCWSFKSNPSVSDSIIERAFGKGKYSFQMSYLKLDTNYYFKAFALNSFGITYGNEIVFRLNSKVPSVYTDTFLNVTYSSASLNGIVLSNGGLPIIESGILYSTNSTFDITNSNKSTSSISLLPNILSDLSGIQGDRDYFFRAYALNGTGVGYGNIKKFKTESFENSFTSQQIILGGPNNSINWYRFFGVADGFKRYRAGAIGNDIARDNSRKIDFLFFYNPSSSWKNVLFSPDYNFAAGTGWATEVSTWPSKNKTIFKLVPDITASMFTAMNASNFIKEVGLIDWNIGTVDILPNLSASQVIAFKKSDGKSGFLLIENIAPSANGQIVIICKSDL